MLSQSVQGTVVTPFTNLANEFSSGIMGIQLQTDLPNGRVVGLLDGNVEPSTYLTNLLMISFRQRLQCCSLFGHVALASRIGVPTDSLLESPDFQEHCPACKALIPLGHSSTVTCLNSHV